MVANEPTNVLIKNCIRKGSGEGFGESGQWAESHGSGRGCWIGIRGDQLASDVCEKVMFSRNQSTKII